jgi:hypothetical protein
MPQLLKTELYVKKVYFCMYVRGFACYKVVHTFRIIGWAGCAFNAGRGKVSSGFLAFVCLDHQCSDRRSGFLSNSGASFVFKTIIGQNLPIFLGRYFCSAAIHCDRNQAGFVRFIESIF